MSQHFEDPFDEDMRLTKGRYYPPEPRDPCSCTPATYWEPASLCAACEERMEAEARDQCLVQGDGNG